jgi:prepilin-type processing-associated H-X9-DG protein
VRTRGGNSLLELLLAVTVVAVLAGLFLAAVQKVRAAAARLQCGNQLRQVALAAHLHHDSAGALPPGTHEDRYGRPYGLLGWLAFLLPGVEQGPLWDQVVAEYQALPQGGEYPSKRVVVKAFTCPADDRTRTAWRLTGGPQVALSSYLGNGGTDSVRRDGVLYYASRTRLTDVSDGTSSTLLAGERPPGADLWFGWWHKGYGQAGDGSLDATLGVREVNRVHNPDRAAYRACGRGPYPFTAGRIDYPCSAFHFWSLHPGGANFAFCDGSVRFLSYSGDPALPALATRAGGEVAALD